MNRIEVNPSLFITCRLCLEDLGIYQIDPKVKEMILYCFDIKIELFDGLPQLICKKCAAILSDYAVIKKKYVDKQDELKTKVQGAQNDEVSKCQANVRKSVENLDNNIQKRCTSRIKRNSPSTDTECDNIKENEIVTKKGVAIVESDNSKIWPGTGYKKYYVCRICNSLWMTVTALNRHITKRHYALKKKFNNIFRKHCEVKLNKTDFKHTNNGSTAVMYSKKKIIENVNPNYYIVYTTHGLRDDEKFSDTENNDEQSLLEIKKIIRSNYHESSDSSDDDVVLHGPKRRKTRRILSRSSNETVVLDKNDSKNSDNKRTSQRSYKNETISSECINIDDSSEESETGIAKQAMESESQIHIGTKSNKVLEADEGTINDIINTCQNKYFKKHYHEDSSKHTADIARQLKRKILSIGRKVISKKKGVNCTPLLRFVELKNLDIVWLCRSMVYVNQESNHIRIMTRIKNSGESSDCETGWTDYIANQSRKQVPSKASNSNEVNNIGTTNTESNVTSNQISAEFVQMNTQEVALTDSAVLIADGLVVCSDIKKLLNANPVANPKQLPKKCVPNEAKVAKVIAPNQDKSSIEITTQQNNDFDMCMPIITSTTSLAVPLMLDVNNHAFQTNSLSANQTAEAPRIKVKPVSELMSVETLNRLNDSAGISTNIISKPVLNHNNIVNIYVPMSQMQTVHTNIGLVAPEPAWKNEFMILNTIDMPNTKTYSPIQYFKTLLQMHNIVLLDTDEALTSEYHCLIKFKVLYKQESNNQPVILCLALYCFKNTFCLKVKDRNHQNINLTKISPNWQWEVLKIYKGEVVTKLLGNAQKVGQDVYEFTNSFVCLLKSINVIK